MLLGVVGMIGMILGWLVGRGRYARILLMGVLIDTLVLQITVVLISPYPDDITLLPLVIGVFFMVSLLVGLSLPSRHSTT